MAFTEADRQWMRLALGEAQAAMDAGDYPVGALLTVDGEVWGVDRNSLFSDGRTTAHAEHNLVARLSPRLREALQDPQPHHICLYTTLEPCLMCLGIAVLHRVNRIVIACPDPNGGTTDLDIESLGSVYRRWWPTIETGLMRDESCRLIMDFLRTGKFRAWQSMLAEFEQLQNSWRDTDSTLSSDHEAPA